MNLNYFKNCTPKSILDIGCNVGQFYRTTKEYWPNADFFLIDGNPQVENSLIQLKVPYHIAVLSDKEKDVTWYESKALPLGTGHSYYKENTPFYSKDKLVQKIARTQTLDNIFTTESFDLIKLDTQGSELDILQGGFKLCGRAKYLILEVAVDGCNYNEGAPQETEIIKFMSTLGFKQESVLGYIRHEGEVSHKDMLFKK